MLKRLKGALKHDALDHNGLSGPDKSSVDSHLSSSSSSSPTSSPTSPAERSKLSRVLMGYMHESRNYLEPPRNIPDLNVPDANGIVDVRIINTTTHSRTRTDNVLSHSLPGHETLSFPSHAFLIRNLNQDIDVLFDLGMRKDWENACPPAHRPYISDDGSDTPLQVTVEKNIQDILSTEATPANIRVDDVSAVIWSSHHFDHRGDISVFPSYTRLIVGPGLRDTYENKEVDEAEFSGRDVLELQSSDFPLNIGGFPAHDCFGDGSFYLLSCPGPSIGHLCGLARVTIEPVSTFVFLGGDCAYHCGEFRPSPYVPLPRHVSFKPATWSYEPSRGASAPVLKARRVTACSGEYIRDNIHPLQSAGESFYETPSEPAISNHTETNESLAKVELFDACPEVLVCISHDPALLNVLPFYPFSISDWYKRGYKQKLHWEFLCDFGLEREVMSMKQLSGGAYSPR